MKFIVLSLLFVQYTYTLVDMYYLYYTQCEISFLNRVTDYVCECITWRHDYRVRVFVDGDPPGRLEDGNKCVLIILENIN